MHLHKLTLINSALFLTLLIGCSTAPNNVIPSAPPRGTSSGASPQLSTDIPACPSDLTTPFFDSFPLALDDFIAFRPLGFLALPIHVFPAKHSAFSMRLPGDPPVSKPIKAPGTIWVAEIWEATFSTGGANYQLFMYPCRDVRVYFGHIASLSEKLKAALQQSTPTCNSFNDGTATVTTCRHQNLAVALDSGEQFGVGPDTAGIDFGVVDFRRPPAAFIQLEHYDHYYPYYASPLDYFVPELKQALESKTGNVFGTQWRTAAPIGGTYMQDLPDTAQGNWFLPGKYHNNTADLSGFMSLVHDYVDPTQPVMSIGNSIAGIEIGEYAFTAKAEGLINRDFSQVTADGKIYCYDNFLSGSPTTMPLKRPNGILLLTMPTPTSLKIELRSEKACAAVSDWLITNTATEFVR
jgi:hypothetical protein